MVRWWETEKENTDNDVVAAAGPAAAAAAVSPRWSALRRRNPIALRRTPR